ncbi:MAG: PDZ domain-containing protein [Arcobacteraceae bacterium]|nr:PDZ domain-containing protein [Arcobacteraceae bacterium]
MNINFSSMIKQFIPFFVIISIAYVLNSIIFFMLPKESIEVDKKQNIHLEYRKFNIKTTFKEVKVIIKKQTIKLQKQEYQLLSNIQLKAVYSMGEETGWIILEDKSKNTHMLSVGESFKGYELIRVYLNYVIFYKANQEYKLSLKDDNKVSYSVNKVTTQSNTKGVLNPIDDASIVVLDDKISVKRAYLNSYINNFDTIWKDISIQEIKDKSGKINGFKVNKVRKNSAFSKLGLKKDDIIKAINNIKLKSYNDAFTVYKKINKLKNLNIKILRNGNEMELDYEIK